VGNPGTDRCLRCVCRRGIRSATFNLGVIQTLARIGLWGSSTICRVSRAVGTLRHGCGLDASAGVAEVVRELGKVRRLRPAQHRAQALVNLREYSNYLTPALGLFSGDTWSAAATIVRNLLLNWLLLVPLLASVIGVPLLFLLVIRTSGIPKVWSPACLILAVVTEIIASVLIYRRAGSPRIQNAAGLFHLALRAAHLPRRHVPLDSGSRARPAVGPAGTPPTTLDLVYLWDLRPSGASACRLPGGAS